MGLRRMQLGSVAERVVRYAHCPVLVVRRVQETGVMLAATDLSDPSVPAVEAAVRLARELKLRPTLVHVAELPSHLLSGFAPLGPIPSVPDEETLQQVRTAALTLLEDLLSREGIEGEARVLSHHNPAACIVSQADDIGAELVVVGTHGRTGLARMTLGSVAEQVVGQAHCSVMVVRLER